MSPVTGILVVIWLHRYWYCSDSGTADLQSTDKPQRTVEYWRVHYRIVAYVGLSGFSLQIFISCFTNYDGLTINLVDGVRDLSRWSNYSTGQRISEISSCERHIPPPPPRSISDSICAVFID